MEREKPNDFGGIPLDVYKRILQIVTPPRPPGLTEDMAAGVIFQMMQERHAALLPGAGRTGFMDAYKAFEELDQAIAGVQGAAVATMGAAATRLSMAIAAIAQLWANGPVADEFFSE